MKNSIPPVLTIDKSLARRFVLAHHGLLPPRPWHGKEGILTYIRRAGCIQFDPVNVVARNPELALQARIAGYRPDMLEDLLYNSRLLVDGFDKVSAIHLMEDWPAFTRYRQHVRSRHHQRADLDPAFMEKMVSIVRERGPVSSLEFEKTVRMVGYWGADMHIERFALERLLALGEILIHHRVGNRRYYDIPERLLPAELIQAPDPFASLEQYQDWHVLRRIGGGGIARHSGAEFWLGMMMMKSGERWETLMRLASEGLVLPIAIEELPGQIFFVRTSDWERFKTEPEAESTRPETVILGPLDNLVWDRELLRMLFDFNYTWEVYVPQHRRVYGPYTLPVLLGDAFIARFDPKFDRSTKTLLVKAWWWEKGYTYNEKIGSALNNGFSEFIRFLGAEQIQLDGAFSENDPLHTLEQIQPAQTA
jgi:uncharacterized protein YcaQ